MAEYSELGGAIAQYFVMCAAESPAIIQAQWTITGSSYISQTCDFKTDCWMKGTNKQTSWVAVSLSEIYWLILAQLQ